MGGLISRIRHRLGIWRSVGIYYWKPGNRRKLRRFYRQFVRSGELCFDVGAHLGNRSATWLAMGCRVVAIEPQPACLRYLRRRFARQDRMTILPVAVADAPGQRTLHVSALTPTISSLAGGEWQQTMQALSSFHVRWDYDLPVEVVTLEQLIEQHGLPAFCKIDVEDLELAVLQGLRSQIPALSFEYLSARIGQTLTCIRYLADLGDYVFNWSFGESLRFESERWLEADEILGILSHYDAHQRSGDVYAQLRIEQND